MPKYRKWKVPRGTGAKLARKGWSKSHLSRVIAGERPGSPALQKELERVERRATEKR